ncbi:MAG: hypothetical protein M3Y39_00495 [Chloroflexota bacterium]|nr:hypothetical protein [Chloroflexota bacterium]
MIVQNRLHPGTNSAFRTLLFVGDLLALLLFWFIWSLQRHMPGLHGFDLWIAGLTVTLGLLFVCARGSARLNGYGRSHDPWLRIATAIMFVLCFVAVISY